MKWLFAILVCFVGTQTCFGQCSCMGVFSPAGTPFFHVPVGQKIHYETMFRWGTPFPKTQPCDGYLLKTRAGVTVDTDIRLIYGQGSSLDSIVISIYSDEPACFLPPAGVFAMCDSTH